MKSPETSLQIEIVRLFDSVVPKEKARLFAVPNGGKRDIRTASILKSMGVRSGVPDLVLILDKGRTIWIELKAPKSEEFNFTGKNKAGGRLSETQKDYQSFLTSHGHDHRLFSSKNEFALLLAELGLIHSFV